MSYLLSVGRPMLLQYEKINYMMRLDETRIPTAFKCATVSSSELKLLRKVLIVLPKCEHTVKEHSFNVFCPMQYFKFLLYFFIIQVESKFEGFL